MPPQQINPLAYLSQFTGYDDQGGYAVANDAGKLFANALAEYEARMKSPRMDIYGRTLHEDTPEYLKQELIDPIIYRFGLNTLTRPAAAAKTQTYHVGDALVERDAAGNLVPVYNAPAKPEKQPVVSVPVYPPGTNPTTAHALGIVPTTVRGDLSKVASMVGTNMPPSLLAPTVSAPAPAASAPALNPTGFIGIPGGTNLFTQAVRQGKQAVESGANPAAGTRQIGRFTVKSK